MGGLATPTLALWPGLPIATWTDRWREWIAILLPDVGQARVRAANDSLRPRTPNDVTSRKVGRPPGCATRQGPGLPNASPGSVSLTVNPWV